MSILDTLVTDRTASDVADRTKKGYYNAEDLNRVQNAVNYLADWFMQIGYTVEGYEKGTVWSAQDIPNSTQMEQYRINIAGLRGALAVLDTVPKVPETMDKLSFSSANDIEKILLAVEETMQRMESVFQRSNVWNSGGVMYPLDMYYAWEIVALPEQTSEVVYNGTEQAPNWGSDSDKYIVISGGSSVDSGEYTATIKPMEGYKWPDGSVAAKTFQWSIQKATGVLSLVPTSLEMSKENWQDKISVDYTGDGELSLTKNGNSVSATLSGNVVSLMSIATGTTVITVTATEGNNYTAAPPVSCTVNVVDVIRSEPTSGLYNSGAAQYTPDTYR